MAENVTPKAGPRSGVVIAVIAVVVLLALIFFYWMGAWRDTGVALDPDATPDARLEQPAPGTTP